MNKLKCEKNIISFDVLSFGKVQFEVTCPDGKVEMNFHTLQNMIIQ